MTMLAAPGPAMSIGSGDSRDQRVQKTAERVASEIVSLIVSERMRTGDRLAPEAVMVDQYGASRSSVREALRLLEVQGVVSIKPGPRGGATVGRVDPANLARTTSLYFHLGGATYESVLRTEAMFEPICAQLAARHPDRVLAMQRFAGMAATPTASRSRSAHGETLRAEIHRLAANPIISMLTQAIGRIVADHFADVPGTEPGSPAAHAELVAAVAAGESEHAGRVMFTILKARHDHYRKAAPHLLDAVIEWR